jgi:dCTP deaminase
MILSALKLKREIERGNACDSGGISVIPAPNLAALVKDGEASIGLRLGRWFLSLRQAGATHLKTTATQDDNEGKYGKKFFVPFGDPFILHPGRFVLASTLEWIKLPAQYSALVIGKSSLGRRGVIIETAAGVHPGFSGCLTLEIANVGEIPVELVAGMMIGQLFIYGVDGQPTETNSRFAGQRRPRLGKIKNDEILERLDRTKS